jgi:hypothetical protein
VSRCQHCGREVEGGKTFCPHCGKPVAAGVEGAGGQRVSAPSPDLDFGGRKEEADKSRRTIFIAVALASAVLVAGLVWLATRPSTRTGDPRLAGALRPGSPEFEQIRERLVVEFNPDEDADIGPTALGTYTVILKPTVRNFTGRPVSGLEFHAAGLDLAREVIRERTFVWQQGIEPNKVSTVTFSLNFPQDNRPASLKLDLTGVTFK